MLAKKKTACLLVIGLIIGSVALLLGLAQEKPFEGMATGAVFIDQNGNLSHDDGEPGIAGVAVSDGLQVVTTGTDGSFTLQPDPEAKFIFISIPSGYLPAATWYRKISEDVDFSFPMTECLDDSPLVFVQLSDTHFAADPAEFREAFYDRRMRVLPQEIFDDLISEVNALSPDFVILTGDIVASAERAAPELVNRWMAYMAGEFAGRFDAPFFGVVGDHDVVRDETIAKAIYEEHFGPTYYSFNMKGVHFVVLDTQELSGTRLVRTVSPRQLSWLEQNLAVVCPQVPIVVFSHAPTPDWADTPENAALLDLLRATNITALLSGNLHVNYRFQHNPFYERTSGAVSGSWWEGGAPDGRGSGYRVFQMKRGQLRSIWRSIGEQTVDLIEPQEAVVVWSDTLQAAMWGEAKAASWRINDGPSMDASVFYNTLWSTVYGNLNFSTLDDGYHSLRIEFLMADGSTISCERLFRVSNPDISIEEMKAHSEAFLGRVVAVPRLEVRAIIGRSVAASDGTATILIDRVPFPVERRDTIGIVGIYRQHTTTLIRPYDPVFYTKHVEIE